MLKRRMLPAALGVLALLTTAASSVMPQQQTEQLREEFHQTYALGPDGRVSLENINGAVRVTAWERNEVRVDAVKKAYRRERLAEAQIKINADTNGIQIRTDYPDQTQTFTNGEGRYNNPAIVEYTLTVPRGARINSIELINGNLDLEGLTGPVKASSINGRVTARGLSGDTKLSTINGNLDATFNRLDSVGPISLGSINGTVSLTIPSDANAELKASTVHGGISNDFGLPVRHGEYVGRDLAGQLGQGGPRLRLSNVNGNITIRHAADGRALNRATNLLAEPGKDYDDDAEESRIEAREAAREAQREAQRAQLEAQRAQLEAQREAQRAQRDAQREAQRAQREAQRAQLEGQRAAEEAQREAQRAQEEARRAQLEAQRAAQLGQREAERAQQEAQRAQREAQRAQLEAQRAQREAQLEAQRAQQEAQRAQREAQVEAQRAQVEAQREALRAQREAQKAQKEIAKESRRTRIEVGRGETVIIDNDSNGQRLVEREVKSFAVGGSPRVNLQTFDGAITVHGWDKPEVQVTASKRAGTEQQMRGIKVNIEQSGSAINVTSAFDQTFARRIGSVTFNNASVGFEVFVPRTATLRLQSGDGRLLLDGVNGSLDLHTGDGRIEVRDAGGQLIAKTGDGQILVDNFRGSVQTQTGDGRISLDGRFAQLTARTGSGTISLAIPADFNATIETDAELIFDGNMAVTVEPGSARGLRRWKIGSGGTLMTLRTGDGRIILRRSERQP
ncbi:MAG TPA: DUF4097 family beta strand repeat-containing protein [Pyrinomonadaceae bacterium]